MGVMVRNLRRLYFYLMCVGLLSFVAYASFTLLNYSFGSPPQSSPIQGLDSMTYASSLLVVAIILFLSVGGMHYLWIRGDISQDSEAAHGAVRAILLNLVQGVAGTFLLFAGLVTFLRLSMSPAQYAGFL